MIDVRPGHGEWDDGRHRDRAGARGPGWRRGRWLGPDGPVQVLETTPTPDGGATYQVSASRLVPVDDQDPDLASVYIPVPVTAEVEVDGHDSVVGVQVPDADPSTDREARAFTRNLIANGAVRGLHRSVAPSGGARADHRHAPRTRSRPIRPGGASSGGPASP